MKDEKSGARSYKGQVVGDSMSLTINFKWLIQIICLVSVVTFSFWKIEGRIQELERNMVVALEEIELHEQERKIAEEKHIRDLETQMRQEREWFEQELGINFNPFSWGKSKKK